MDYCLDWKQDESEWSVREIVYHILETPPGGAPNLVNKIISGDMREYEIWSDLTNLTSERAAHDIDQVNSDIEAFFSNLSDSAQRLAAFVNTTLHNDEVKSGQLNRRDVHRCTGETSNRLSSRVGVQASTGSIVTRVHCRQ